MTLQSTPHYNWHPNQVRSSWHNGEQSDWAWKREVLYVQSVCGPLLRQILAFNHYCHIPPAIWLIVLAGRRFPYLSHLWTFCVGILSRPFYVYMYHFNLTQKYLFIFFPRRVCRKPWIQCKQYLTSYNGFSIIEARGLFWRRHILALLSWEAG